MFIIFVSLALVFVATLYILLKRHYSYWAIRNVPHEKPKLLFGNMSGIGRKYHWKDINQRIYNRFKGSAQFVGFYTFMTKAAFILDLDLIKQIMVTDFGSFADRGLFHNERDDPLTGNLLFLDGDQWRELRHKLTPVFTTGKIKYMFPTIVKVGDSLVAACEKIILEKNGEFEAKDLFARFTTDVIGTTGFGIECNSLKEKNAEFRRMGRMILEEPRHSLIVQSFMFTNPELARKLRMKNFRDEAIHFFMDVVKKTVDYREKNNIRRNDFMDLLIELKAKSDQISESSQTDIKFDGLTLKQMTAQVLLFFLAGFDTSSTTMSFCVYELAINQDVQEKLRQEIFDVLGKYNNEVTYENIKEMNYLEKVISETLRKHSVLPHIARQAVTDFKVPNSNVTFEKGLRIIIPIESIQNDPNIFPQPEKFDPERFSPQEIAKRHSSAYIPFGDGPRSCIGNRFGKLQVKVGLVQLLKNFQITTTNITEIPPRCARKGFLIAPAGGIHLKLQAIEN